MLRSFHIHILSVASVVSCFGGFCCLFYSILILVPYRISEQKFVLKTILKLTIFWCLIFCYVCILHVCYNFTLQANSIAVMLHRIFAVQVARQTSPRPSLAQDRAADSRQFAIFLLQTNVNTNTSCSSTPTALNAVTHTPLLTVFFSYFCILGSDSTLTSLDF